VVGVAGLTGLRFDDLRLSRCVHAEVTLQDAYPVGEFRPPSHPARWHAAGLDAVWQADTRSPDGPHVSTATCSNSGLLPSARPGAAPGQPGPHNWHGEAARSRQRPTPRGFGDSRTYLGADLRSFIDRHLADG